MIKTVFDLDVFQLSYDFAMKKPKFGYYLPKTADTYLLIHTMISVRDTI